MNATLKSALILSAAMLFAGSALASSESTSAPQAPTQDKAASEIHITSSDVQISTPGNTGAEAQMKICCGTAGDYGVICWRCRVG